MTSFFVRGALAIGLLVLVHAPATHAALFFEGYDGVNGEVRVTQTVLSSEWVNIFIELRLSETYNAFNGGFETQNGAFFRQGSGGITTPENEYDTSFLISAQAVGSPFAMSPTDSSTQLHVQALTMIGSPGNFGPAEEWLPFAQLVMEPGARALAYRQDSDGTIYDHIRFEDAGVLVGELSGSITAVPEPSSIAALGLVAGLYCANRWRRRRKLGKQT
jgi:hypothetical protein